MKSSNESWDAMLSEDKTYEELLINIGKISNEEDLQLLIIEGADITNLAKARVFLVIGDYDNSEKYFAKISIREKEGPKSLLFQSKLISFQGDVDGAIDICDQVIKSSIENKDAAYHIKALFNKINYASCKNNVKNDASDGDFINVYSEPLKQIDLMKMDLANLLEEYYGRGSISKPFYDNFVKKCEKRLLPVP